MGWLSRIRTDWLDIAGEPAAKEAVRTVIWTLLPIALIPAGLGIDLVTPIHNNPNGVPISAFVYGALIAASFVPRSRHQRALRALVLQHLQPHEHELRELEIMAARPDLVKSWIRSHRK